MAQIQRSSDSVYLDLVALWSEDCITNSMDDGARGENIDGGAHKSKRRRIDVLMVIRREVLSNGRPVQDSDH